MKFEYPHSSDKSLDRWMANAMVTELAGESSRAESTSLSDQEQLELAEALRQFHIATICKKLLSNEYPQIHLPPILTSSNANTWLSTRYSKKASALRNSSSGDLSVWLAQQRSDGGSVDKLRNEDYSKWLPKSVPAASNVSSLPGIRVEFPKFPLSAFAAQQLPAKEVTPPSNDFWLKKDTELNMTGATSAASVMSEVDVMDDDDEELFSQWLLIDRGLGQVRECSAPSVTTSSCMNSIEAWLYAAAEDRDPSIITLSDDEF